MNEALVVIIRSIIAFISLHIFARLLGKQQVSQLTFFDYVLGITIGSIAASLSSDLSSSMILKQPIGSHDNVPQYFRLLKESIQKNKWSQSLVYEKNLQSAWRKVLPRIQFSVERDEVNNFQHSLARLKGYLRSQDKPGSLAELEEIKETWRDLDQ